MTFLPTATVETLRLRARLLSATRQFFDSHGYWEVDTPHLSRDTCIDAWIDPVALPAGVSPTSGPLYLQTSPEFAMKRLVVAGVDAIYQLGHVFRGGESGPRHNPEFTMLEWYRVGDSYHDQMTFTEGFVRSIAGLDLGPLAPPISLPTTFERISYDEAFKHAIGTRVLSLETAELVGLAARIGVNAPQSLSRTDRDGWLNLLLAEKVEPWLATLGAVFLLDYPETQSALARVRPGKPAVAERFELYVGRVELCNGYQELTDGEELLRRMRRQNDLRIAAGIPSLPANSRLVDALRAGLPDCSGVALGFDRLLMWRLGAERIDEIIPFPVDRA
ncbi:Elongation factor P--(R)-beta-lysine ligase [Caulifigura coniformis]|uniref:Elongation factor P--(R)-beta-lysine ligase n=1 Tax=Caulifigura coniformis TaxID=2527983 RepID=A0A517SF13_9PLAN|nr:EF-P lysine aminoacylase EpmA [Caulifigura coniformis]QDT54721.1 Elongation factor P--(R)-beta-lysine ligase [Caulifigura coniformis]